MKKTDAIKLFGTQASLAKAMGVSRQLVWQLPEELPQKYVDWIIGAAVREGKSKTDIFGDQKQAS